MARSDDERFRRMRGRKNKALSTARGITRGGLARALGFTSTGAISQVENGLRGLTFESIMNVAKVLDVHPSVLLTPDEMDKDDIEMITEMLRLFEKRKKRAQIRCARASRTSERLCGERFYDV